MTKNPRSYDLIFDFFFRISQKHMSYSDSRRYSGSVLKEKIKKSSVWVVLSCFLSYRSKNEVPVPNTSSTLLVMARGVKGSCPCLLLSISLSPTRTLIRAAKSGADLSHHAMEMWRKKKRGEKPKKKKSPTCVCKNSCIITG